VNRDPWVKSSMGHMCRVTLSDPLSALRHACLLSALFARSKSAELLMLNFSE